MSTVTQCLFKSFRPDSPIGAYRADMKDDVAALVKGGMPLEKAWAEVAEGKLADLIAEQERIAQSVADAYAKTPAGKRAADKATTLSVGARGTGQTIKQVVDELDKVFGEKGLIRGKVEVLQKPSDLKGYDIPADARGAVVGGKAYLFSNNIKKGGALAILLHEVGAHIGFKNIFTEKAYLQLADTIREWAGRRDGSIEARIAKAALIRVAEAGTKKSQLNDEMIAYAVEEAVNAGIKVDTSVGPIQQWLRSVVSALKSALEKFGIAPQTLTAKDLVDMAFGAANLELKGTWHGTGKKFNAFDHSFMSSGEGAQAFGWGTYVAQNQLVAEDYKKQAEHRKKDKAKWDGLFGNDEEDFSIGGESLADFIKNRAGSAADNEMVQETFLGLVQQIDQKLPKKEGFVASLTRELAYTQRVVDYAKDRIKALEAKPQTPKTKRDIAEKKETESEFGLRAKILADALKNKGKIEYSPKNEIQPTMARVLHTRPESDFVLWDAAVEDQSDTVKKGLKATFESFSESEKRKFSKELKRFDGGDGESIYKAMTEALKDRAAEEIDPESTAEELHGEAQKMLSTLLHENGIAGTKFLDGPSRGKPVTGKSNYNYVFYSDKDAEIVGHDLGGAKSTAEPLFSRAKPANPELSAAAQTMFGKDKTKLQELRDAATGISMRVRAIDSYAGLKKALEKGDQTAAIQANFYLMQFAQRNHLTEQAIMQGAPINRKSTHKGDMVRINEAQEGANLKRVSELLGKVEGYGTPQEVNNAFTLLALAKRAQTETWDRVFGDSKNDSAKLIAEKNAARYAADKLAAEYDAGKSPFKEAYREYQEFNKNMLQFAMQGGIISEKEFRRLAGKQNYTPLFRADKNGNLVLQIDQGRDITIGRLADEPHMKQMLGGTGKVMDFFTASVRNASVIIDATLHNFASREAVLALEALGAAHPVSATEKNENTIEFRKDGDLQRFAVDTSGTPAADIPTDLIVKGFAGVPASLSGWVRLMGAPAQVLRKAVTRNPLYMARQLVRDPLSAWLTTGARFNPVTDTLAGVGKALAGTADKSLDRMGLTGGALYADNETDLTRIQEEAQTQGRWWNIGAYMAKLDNAAMAADAITRRNVRDASLKDGASEIQAALAAYESMPFSKRGTSTSIRNMNHMIPFLSASIQGWDVLYRAVKGDMPLADRINIRNQLLARGSMIAALSMMYALAVADDEDYKNANDSERLSNWFVGLPGTDLTLKVPVPFELGIIFKMLPEAIVRVLHSDKEAGSEMRAVGGALLNMAPNLVAPQAVMPLIEATLNKSFFTGNAIEGRALEGLDIGQRYDRNTSELSKALGFDFEFMGKQFGVSPKMLEYVMGQYTAGLYPAFAAIIDNILPAPSVEKPDRTLAQMPLFRSALQQEDAGGEVNRLYDKIEQFTRTSSTFKKLVEQGSPEASEYANKYGAEIARGEMAQKMKAALNKVSEQQNKLMNNAQLTGAQKQQMEIVFKKMKQQMATQFSAALS